MASVIWDDGDYFCLLLFKDQSIGSWVKGNRVIIAEGNIWEGIEAVY